MTDDKQENDRGLSVRHGVIVPLETLPPLAAWYLRPLARSCPKQLRQELLRSLLELQGPRVVALSAHQRLYRVVEIVLTNGLQKRSLLFEGGHCRLSPPKPVVAKRGHPTTRAAPPVDLLSQYNGTFRAAQQLRAILKERWATLPRSARDYSKWTKSKAQEALHNLLGTPCPLDAVTVEDEVRVTVVGQVKKRAEPFSLTLPEFWSGSFKPAELAEEIVAAGCRCSVSSLRRDLSKAKKRRGIRTPARPRHRS